MQTQVNAKAPTIRMEKKFNDDHNKGEILNEMKDSSANIIDNKTISLQNSINPYINGREAQSDPNNTVLIITKFANWEKNMAYIREN